MICVTMVYEFCSREDIRSWAQRDGYRKLCERLLEEFRPKGERSTSANDKRLRLMETGERIAGYSRLVSWIPSEDNDDEAFALDIWSQILGLALRPKGGTRIRAT
jgi:hypothetical protein